MSNICHTFENESDVLTIEGELDNSALDSLGKSITDLRQKGSTRILLLGNGLNRIRAEHLEELALPVRIFRGIGGIIALAEFDKKVLRQFRNASWYRYLNVFNDKKDAFQFLNPSPDN